MIPIRILAFILLFIIGFSPVTAVPYPTVTVPTQSVITTQSVISSQPAQQAAPIDSRPSSDTDQTSQPAEAVSAEPSSQAVATEQASLPLYLSQQTVTAEEDQGLQLALYTMGMDMNGRQILATVSLSNPADQTVTCTLYSVIKNEDGKVTSSTVLPVTVKPGANYISLTHGFDQPEDGDQWTVYCWDRIMQPLCQPITQTLTFEQTITAITPSPQEMDLYLSDGTAKPITYTVTPAQFNDPGVYYYSDNTDVATVSSTGMVTPVAVGTANITLLTKNRTAMAVCRVQVISKPTEIILNATDLTMEETETFQITPNIVPADAPDRTITYQSSNTSVAVVSAKGLITAKKPGTAVITATTGDQKATSQCTVTVISAVKNLKLNKTSISMWDYGMYYLTATYTGGSGQTVKWTSSDHSVATVSDSGIVFGVAKGSAIITASVGTVKTTCKVQVYREYDYMGSIAAYFESRDNPASISGSGTDKSYGCFQLYAGSNGPKTFYNWLIDTGFNVDIGTTLKNAHIKDGGKDKTFGTYFDAAWKNIAKTQADEFRSCQMAYCMGLYYEPLVNRLITEMNFYADNYSLALKAALWSRAIQHGVGGAFNRIQAAFNEIGGFKGKTEKQLIAAIYAECGKVVSTPPSDTSIAMNSNSSIAVEYGLVGKYMKYYSSNSSSVQAGVWKRLNITEPAMLYDLLENPPVIITP